MIPIFCLLEEGIKQSVMSLTTGVRTGLRKESGVLNILAKCCGSPSVTVSHLSFTLLAVTCVLTHVICWRDKT